MAGAVLPDHRIAYFSIPKSASTSMKLALYELREGQAWTGGYAGVHRQFPTHPLKPGDIEATAGFWRFTILRDPVKRLLSSYGNRVVHHGDIAKDVAAMPFRRRLRRFRYSWLDHLPSADDYFLNLDGYRRLSRSILHHTCSITRFIGDDLSVFDSVYTISEIDRLERDLGARTGRDVRLPVSQTEGPKLAFEDLGPRARDAVLRATEDDYRLLADYFEPPRG